MRRIAMVLIAMMAIAFASATCTAADAIPSSSLKVHNIFTSNMVLQRGKPIKVWGWAKPGDTVSVHLGKEKGFRVFTLDARRKISTEFKEVAP